MIQNFFSYDGKFFGVLNKVGEIIIANLLLLLCCIPVVTAASSITSFYYVMVKCVRMERGSLCREFFASMKRTFSRGVLLSVLMVLWGALLFYAKSVADASAGDTLSFQGLLCDVLLCVTGMILVYLFPVFSRFEMKLGSIVKLAFVMSVRYFYNTLLIVAAAAVLGWLLLFKLPMAGILVLPGIGCYAVSFLMEKMLHRYMPDPGTGQKSWYDET